jgi:hypothetical protein
VRSRRRILQLLVVGETPADVVVALHVAQRLERIEVVHPLLDGDVARSVQAVAESVREGRRFGRLTDRVLGAVLETREIAPVAALAPRVAERVDHVAHRERRRQRLLHLARDVQQVAQVRAAQPAPERAGRRGHPDAVARKIGKLMQAGDFGAERLHEGRPDPDHHVAAVDQRRQPRQRLLDRGRIDARIGQIEQDVASHRRHRLDDSRLGRKVHAEMVAAGNRGPGAALHRRATGGGQDRRLTPGSSQA